MRDEAIWPGTGIARSPDNVGRDDEAMTLELEGTVTSLSYIRGGTMALVRIKNFPDRMYAERAQQSLEEEGIESVIQAPDAGILGAGGVAGLPQGADLYVEEEDAEEARRLLSELFNGV